MKMNVFASDFLSQLENFCVSWVDISNWAFWGYDGGCGCRQETIQRGRGEGKDNSLLSVGVMTNAANCLNPGQL